MRYGITQKQYDWLLEQQGDKCFLCGEGETLIHHSTGKLRALSVDHDHRCCPDKKACGECVRGLLCYNCNRFMGRVDNSPLLSTRFRDYQDRRPLAGFYEEDEPVEKVVEAFDSGEKHITVRPGDGSPLDKLFTKVGVYPTEKATRPVDKIMAGWSDDAMNAIYEENWLND